MTVLCPLSFAMSDNGTPLFNTKRGRAIQSNTRNLILKNIQECFNDQIFSSNHTTPIALWESIWLKTSSKNNKCNEWPTSSLITSCIHISCWTFWSVLLLRILTSLQGESKSKQNLKNTQQYCTCKHLISYVLSNCFISYGDLIGKAEQSK